MPPCTFFFDRLGVSREKRRGWGFFRSFWPRLADVRLAKIKNPTPWRFSRESPSRCFMQFFFSVSFHKKNWCFFLRCFFFNFKNCFFFFGCFFLVLQIFCFLTVFCCRFFLVFFFFLFFCLFFSCCFLKRHWCLLWFS